MEVGPPEQSQATEGILEAADPQQSMHNTQAIRNTQAMHNTQAIHNTQETNHTQEVNETQESDKSPSSRSPKQKRDLRTYFATPSGSEPELDLASESDTDTDVGIAKDNTSDSDFDQSFDLAGDKASSQSSKISEHTQNSQHLQNTQHTQISQISRPTSRNGPTRPESASAAGRLIQRPSTSGSQTRPSQSAVDHAEPQTLLSHAQHTEIRQTRSLSDTGPSFSSYSSPSLLGAASSQTSLRVVIEADTQMPSIASSASKVERPRSAQPSRSHKPSPILTSSSSQQDSDNDSPSRDHLPPSAFVSPTLYRKSQQARSENPERSSLDGKLDRNYSSIGNGSRPELQMSATDLVRHLEQLEISLENKLGLAELHMKQSQSKGMYGEAHIAQKTIERLQQLIRGNYLAAMKDRHSEEIRQMDMEHQVTMRQFDDKLSNDLENFNFAADEHLMKLKEEYLSVVNDLKDRRDAMIDNPKFSNQVLVLRMQQEAYAKQQRFIEAHKAKAKAEEMERDELAALQIKKETLCNDQLERASLIYKDKVRQAKMQIQHSRNAILKKYSHQKNIYVQKYVRNREVLIKNQAKEIKDLQRQRICGIVPVEYYSSIPRISGTKSRPVSGKPQVKIPSSSSSSSFNRSLSSSWGLSKSTEKYLKSKISQETHFFY